jgi:hypothetical protein
MGPGVYYPLSKIPSLLPSTYDQNLPGQDIQPPSGGKAARVIYNCLSSNRAYRELLIAECSMARQLNFPRLFNNSISSWVGTFLEGK